MGCADRVGRDRRWRLRPARDLAGEGRHAAGPPLILSHFLLAATGLVIWIAYVATDNDTLAWIALVLLAIVAVLGFTMFAIWYQRRQRGPTARTGVTGEPGSSETPPEQHFPVAIVGLHGLLAVTTVVLVFLTAIGVGES
jgi:hypothetical protein